MIAVPADLLVELAALLKERVGLHIRQDSFSALRIAVAARLEEQEAPPANGAYVALLRSEKGDDELRRLLPLVTVGKTNFFRDERQFRALEALLPPLLSRVRGGGRRLAMCSAGCATGEEPYSLAMALLSRLPPEWRLEILATDLSTKALRQAKSGVYPMARLADVPEALRRRYLLRGVGGQSGKFRVGAELQRVVAFRRENLLEEPASARARFDLVLCRNVLMYFRPETRRAVVERLVERLAPAGHFCVGHSESLHGFDGRLRTVIPTVYQHCGEPR